MQDGVGPNVSVEFASTYLLEPLTKVEIASAWILFVNINLGHRKMCDCCGQERAPDALPSTRICNEQHFKAARGNSRKADGLMILVYSDGPWQARTVTCFSMPPLSSSVIAAIYRQPKPGATCFTTDSRT